MPSDDYPQLVIIPFFLKRIERIERIEQIEQIEQSGKITSNFSMNMV